MSAMLPTLSCSILLNRVSLHITWHTLLENRHYASVPHQERYLPILLCCKALEREEKA
jgi:hypothetical protein